MAVNYFFMRGNLLHLNGYLVRLRPGTCGYNMSIGLSEWKKFIIAKRNKFHMFWRDWGGTDFSLFRMGFFFFYGGVGYAFLFLFFVQCRGGGECLQL